MIIEDPIRENKNVMKRDNEYTSNQWKYVDVWLKMATFLTSIRQVLQLLQATISEEEGGGMKPKEGVDFV